jgi:kynurenine formamidase
MSEVERELSRRHFLGAFGASVAAAIVPQEAAHAQEKPVRLPKGFRDIYDLTHTLSPKTPVYPAFKPIQIIDRFSYERDGFYCKELVVTEHTGTHMDAPIHFISIKARAEKDADAGVTVDDLMAWEKRYGRLPRGAFVAMDSGWDARIVDAGKFINADAKGTLHFPGLTGDAAKLLAQERDIVGVGVDTVSLDRGVAQSPVAHLTLLGAGKYGIELMANLGTVPPSGATVIIGGPKHLGATGGQVRVYAVM